MMADVWKKGSISKKLKKNKEVLIFQKKSDNLILLQKKQKYLKPLKI